MGVGVGVCVEGDQHLSGGDCTFFHSSLFSIQLTTSSAHSHWFYCTFHTQTHTQSLLSLHNCWYTPGLKHKGLELEQYPPRGQYTLDTVNARNCHDLPNMKRQHQGQIAFNSLTPPFLKTKCRSISLKTQSRLPKTTWGNISDGIMKVNLNITGKTITFCAKTKHLLIFLITQNLQKSKEAQRSAQILPNLVINITLYTSFFFWTC